MSLNGRFLAPPEAKIDFLDPGFHESKAVYTSVRTYDGKPFRLEQHLKRLASSAEEVGFPLSVSLEKVREWVLQIIQEADFDPQFLRITATPENLFIQSRHLEIDSQVYDGVRVMSYPMTREMVKAKVVGTPGTIKAYLEAQSQAYYEALLFDPFRKVYTEGSRSNILWVKDQQLFWCDQALSGITQGAVLECAVALKIPVIQSFLDIDEVQKIDELFLTQTSRGLVPILQVDEKVIGNGKRGSVTEKLMKCFENLIEQS